MRMGSVDNGAGFIVLAELRAIVEVGFKSRRTIFYRKIKAHPWRSHVPVNADVHEITVIFVDEPDKIINPMGIKGLGEIGIVGVAAAIANAVYHATGKRVRDLPITLDKLHR